MSDTSIAAASGYEWHAYNYVPSLGLNIEFTVLFGLFSIYEIVSMIRTYRTYRLDSRVSMEHVRRFVLSGIPFVVGTLMECIGYIGRILNHYDNTQLDAYIMQSLLLLIAPAFLAASCYMIFTDVLRHIFNDNLSKRYNYLTKFYVFGDVLSILFQGAGGGLLAAQMNDVGKTLIIIGLFLQIFFFGTFTCLIPYMLYNVKEHPSLQGTMKTRSRTNWRYMLVALLSICALILVRSIFRVIEYLEGINGDLISNEKYLFILDSTMIFFACFIYVIQHFSKCLCRLRIMSYDSIASGYEITTLA